MSISTAKIGTLEYRTAEGIGVPHGFTTRLGGVSTGTLASLNLGLHRGDAPENVVENFRILGDALGFDPMQLVMTKQIHSDIVCRVGQADWGKYTIEGASPVCDALITNTPGTALAVFTADCTPVLLWDPVTGAVGAVHAGWRGTAQDIVGKTVQAMQRSFGCDPAQLRAAIGPNIGQCCFQTGPEVPQALLQTYGSEIECFMLRQKEKTYPDLKQINAFALQRAGVTHIEISQECTMCRPNRFWSHRVHGAQRGSQGAIIVCKEGRP